MTISDFLRLADAHGLTSVGVPCPDSGDFAYTIDTLDEAAGCLLQHFFYFAASVQECLSKQAALHRWMDTPESEAVA